MRKILQRRLILSLIGFAAITAALIVVLTRPAEGSVGYHLSKYSKLIKGPYAEPESIGDWLKPSTFTWLTLGSPTNQEWAQEMFEHQDALVELGHFCDYGRMLKTLRGRVGRESPNKPYGSDD